MMLPLNKWIVCKEKAEIDYIVQYCKQENILLNGVCAVDKDDIFAFMLESYGFVAVAFRSYADVPEKHYLVYLDSENLPHEYIRCKPNKMCEV